MKKFKKTLSLTAIVLVLSMLMGIGSVFATDITPFGVVACPYCNISVTSRTTYGPSYPDSPLYTDCNCNPRKSGNTHVHTYREVKTRYDCPKCSYYTEDNWTEYNYTCQYFH